MPSPVPYTGGDFGQFLRDKVGVVTEQPRDETSSSSHSPADTARDIAAGLDPEVPMISGKLVISTMVGVGVVLAAFAWWSRYSASQQVLATLGKDAVIAIRTGEKAELLRGIRLAGKDQAEDNLAFDFTFDEVTDISKTPGLIHARHHLVHQKGFHWDAEREDGVEPTWEVGLRFTREDRVATMLFDFGSGRALLVEKQAEVTIRPIIIDALKKFLAGLE